MTQESANQDAKPHTANSGWVADPEHSDETIEAKTGRSWNEWVAAIDAGPGRHAGHTAIAAWLHDEQGVDAWWAQGVTVGYERITGIRLPGQMPDGTFSVSRSRTLPGEVETARELILDDEKRIELLPDLRSTLRSSPSAKRMRFDLIDETSGNDAGVLAFTIDPAKNGIKLVVTHEKLPTFEAAETWKAFWVSGSRRLNCPSDQRSPLARAAAIL